MKCADPFSSQQKYPKDVIIEITYKWYIVYLNIGIIKTVFILIYNQCELRVEIIIIVFYYLVKFHLH